MMNRFHQTNAPYIPVIALYNENIKRNSEISNEKPKNIKDALFGVQNLQNKELNLK